MAAPPVANPCDSLEVDLSRIDIDVEIQPAPCINVQVSHPDMVIEIATVANQGPPGETGETGEKGDTGDTGQPGAPGIAATVDAGTTTTGAPGTNASVENVGSLSTAIFDFTIPRGATGATGPQGQGIQVKGTVPTSANLPTTGNQPGDLWIASDTGHGWSWSGTAWVDTGPIQGPKGDPGTAATATAGATVTGAAGTNAAVANIGTLSNAIFDFTIPRGNTGAQGPAGTNSTVPGPPGSTGSPGAAATVTAGTTTTGTPGSAANVTNSGSSSAAIFNFLIPRGDVGATGSQGVPGSTGSVGPVGPAGPSTPSANTGNLLTTGSDALLYLPPSAIQPTIWSTRLRSYNSAGNQNFEVDQRNCNGPLSYPAGNSTQFQCDRWYIQKIAATGAVQGIVIGGTAPAGIVNLPGTLFGISRSYLQAQVTTTQASLAATEFLMYYVNVEGPMWRELASDVHSVSVLCACSLPSFKFSIAIRPVAAPAYSLVLPGTTSATGGQFSLVTFPNLPVWSPSSTLSPAPGQIAYTLGVCLGTGTTYQAPSTGTWQAGNFIGYAGQSNLLATNSAIFYLAFVQHEPGPICTTLQDKPFSQNYDECLRYYQKSYNYGLVTGSVSNQGSPFFNILANSHAYQAIRFHKPMAKQPNVLGYSPATGAINMVRNLSTNADMAINGVSSYSGETGFSGFNLTTPPTVVNVAQFHYIADTFW